MPSEPGRGEDRIEPWVWRIAAVVMMGSVMSILDTTIVNIALARLGTDFHKTVAATQWVVTGYMLALAAVIPLSGWAARRFGTKRAYLFSLVVFTAGSALCGCAQSLGQLVIFRVIQGAGGGMLMPLGQLLMANAVGPKRMGRVMSAVLMPAMLAPIFGPVLGGLIVDGASWRWIFYINLPVGIVAVFASIKMLPPGRRELGRPLDVRGLALMVLGLPLFTYGLAQSGSSGVIGSKQVLLPTLVGGALIVLFVSHARRAKNALLDMDLYRKPTFTAASVALFCLTAVMFGTMLLMPLYWQQVRGESVATTGWLISPMAFGFALGLPFASRLASRFGGGPLALAGVIGLTLASIPFAFVGTHTPVPLLLVAMCLRGISASFAMMPAITAAYAALTRAELSDATPQLNVLQRVGGSIGTAVLAVVLQRGLAHAHDAGAVAGAYDKAFLLSVALTVVAIGPVVVLLRAERAARLVDHPRDAADPSESQAIAEALA